MQEFNIDAHMACRFRRPDLRKRHLSPQLIALHELMYWCLPLVQTEANGHALNLSIQQQQSKKKKCFSMRKRSIKKTHYVPLA